MSPIFKCLICRKDIERSTKTFWVKKGHLLCSTCLDSIEKKNLELSKLNFNSCLIINFINQRRDDHLEKQNSLLLTNTIVKSY